METDSNCISDQSKLSLLSVLLMEYGPFLKSLAGFIPQMSHYSNNSERVEDETLTLTRCALSQLVISNAETNCCQ